MKNRIILKEIPTGKFHSAIFTTFSINLYYLEQQVLPLLSRKGIHYVSILADSNMLSMQLGNYAYLSQKRKRNYAVNGIHSNGAFHPKLIFLAGTDSVLLLIGSGNLTTSGHGKNLEVWNPVYINNIDDKKLGFVIHAWNYFKQLHIDLGDSANNKIKSIEENCSLLSKTSLSEDIRTFELNRHSQISFHANQPNNSLFKQVSEIVGDEKIKRITIMSPFYDIGGKFITELNKRYSPKQIDVLIQKKFGTLPTKMPLQANVHFFDWLGTMQEIKQNYFHAKNIVLEGVNRNFLVSGSANASIAAFGTLNNSALNFESCIIYQSSKDNFLDLLSIKIKGKTVSLKEYESDLNEIPFESSKHPNIVFIKSTEQNFENISFLAHSKEKIEKGLVKLFDSKGVIKFEEKVSFKPGDNAFRITLKNNVALIYSEVSKSGRVISNKQFITDINAFESTNPSPKNRSLNQIRKLIEGGNFSTPKIIDYLNTVYRQKVIKKGISKISQEKKQDDELPNERENDLLYLSYSEIQERAKQIDNQEKANHYIEYKSVRLWESIFSYLKESREKELQSKIDEEETENINTSLGRTEEREPKKKRAISKSNYERLNKKVIKFLDSYSDILLKKITNENSDKPSLIDLSMYLIMLEILLHLIGHKETIEGKNDEIHLIPISISNKDFSWSNYLLQYIGMFTMWCSQKKEFKDFDSPEYKLKLEYYKTMALKTNLSALAIFNIVNKKNKQQELNNWVQLNLLNSNLVFNMDKVNYDDLEEYISFIPLKVIEDSGEADIEDEILNHQTFINKFKANNNNIEIGDYYFNKDIGYTILEKVITNPKNTFYKLFRPGFQWDDTSGNYWNKKVYSIKENRWFNCVIK